MSNGNYSLLLAATFFAVATTAFAVEDIQQLERRIEKKPIEPKATEKPLFPSIQAPLPPEKADKIRFILKKIEISGNTIYSQEELAPLYDSLLGKNISLTDVYTLISQITAKYGSDGYGLSRAYLPAPQGDFQKDGIIKINILEGYIDDVIFEGTFEDNMDMLQSYKTKILAERPISTQTLERYLLLANDLPGISVTSTLNASKTNPGASTLIFKIQDKKYSGFLSFDNRGTKNFGSFQSNVGLSLENPFGFFSKTDFMYANAGFDELHYYSLSHAQTLNSEGTTFKASSTYSDSAPGSQLLRSLQQKSESFSFSVGLEQPIIRTRQTNLTAFTKFDFKDTQSFSMGQHISYDKIRVFRLGANFDYADVFAGINQAILVYSHGLGVLGSIAQNSPLKTRADGDINFNKWTLSLTRTQQLGIIHEALAQFSLKTSFEGQYSLNSLLSAEECGIGGIQYGRAYDSSEIVGDSCMAISIEPQYLFPIQSDYLKYLQMYAYWDMGEAVNRNSTPTNLKHQSITSTGGGFRFGFPYNISGYFEITQPLYRPVISQGNKDTRFFANIAVGF
jgi:hemolysin activation/secretion protein